MRTFRRVRNQEGAVEPPGMIVAVVGTDFERSHFIREVTKEKDVVIGDSPESGRWPLD